MEIKHLVTGKVLFSADVSTWRELVELAVKQGANLNGAYLKGAYLEGAYLKGAYLKGAYLNGANLKGANFEGAYLYGAYLYGANLNGAYLEGANLKGAVGTELAIARTRILPPEGNVIGWKKLSDGVIAKICVPDGVPRSHAFGRKCRAERAQVLELFGAEVGISQHDGRTKYKVGEMVICHHWEEDWMIECAGGIHFFITREEAEAY